jgi:regulator of protease activity HflC (stomatin/prohibitin superfamily)
LIWIVSTCGEQLFRLLFAWLRPTPEGSLSIPAVRLAVREALLVTGNPISSLFQTVEERFGVSFRSSWAISFVRRATIPVLLLVVLLLWGLSSLCVVRIDNLGVRETFGRVTAAPLDPGLHWKLPWPFGRVRQFPVKRVSTQTIGFVSGERRQPAYLWSKQHAEKEFALVLGAGSEVVAVDSMLYYKTREDRDRFLEYVYRWQNPEEALEAYAYRSLMEQTRSATLDDVLSANRAEFGDRLEESVRGYATENHLGIDVVEVALMGLHPPVEAASDYLDVISARIDAERLQIEAEGEALAEVQHAQRESASAVRAARVESAKRMAQSQEESAEFLAIGAAYSVAPNAFKLRIWFEILEEILQEKPFALVDKAFSGGPGGLLIDQRSDADLRDPVPVSRSANPLR